MEMDDVKTIDFLSILQPQKNSRLMAPMHLKGACTISSGPPSNIAASSVSNNRGARSSRGKLSPKTPLEPLGAIFPPIVNSSAVIITASTTIVGNTTRTLSLAEVIKKFYVSMFVFRVSENFSESH